MAELVKKFENEIEMISLIPSEGGRFEVLVDGGLLYSKLQTDRHPKEGEIIELLQKYIQDRTT